MIYHNSQEKRSWRSYSRGDREGPISSSPTQRMRVEGYISSGKRKMSKRSKRKRRSPRTSAKDRVWKSEDFAGQGVATERP